MNIIQGILHSVEEGKARILTRLIPFTMVLLVVLLAFNLRVFNGLIDAQSMDNAQLARQIARGAGFTTKFVRPYALSQLNSVALKNAPNKAPGLFPDAQYPKGVERLVPDTYNAPGYPYLLGQWFRLLNPGFDQTPQQIAAAHSYSPDHRIPWLNQIFLLLTGGLIYVLGLRLFDNRVAWIAMLAFFVTNLVWQFSVTGLSTSFLMFLCTLMLVAATEIFSIAEARSKESEVAFWPAWLWALLLSVVLGVACLTRLDLLILLIPFGIFFFVSPPGCRLLIAPMVLIVLVMTVPWFWNMYKISGSPIGSNIPLLHYGIEGHEGNQIYCVLTPPEYQQLFKDLANKEFIGFGWSLLHGWEMLGCCPLVILFFASILHDFKQGKSQAFRWLIFGLAVAVIVSTSGGSPRPAALDTWNGLIIFLPGMLVVGSAFFHILLDRLRLDLWILNNAIATALIILCSFPIIGALVDARGNRAYPPYSPAALRAMGNFVHTEDWITSDMPWAVAWYGDHASVWIPDTIADFDDIYDNYNNSGLLLITPVLLSTPTTTFTSGEYKDWLPFISGSALPANFPLRTRAPSGAGSIEYMIWGRPPGA